MNSRRWFHLYDILDRRAQLDDRHVSHLAFDGSDRMVGEMVMGPPIPSPPFSPFLSKWALIFGYRTHFTVSRSRIEAGKYGNPKGYSLYKRNVIIIGSFNKFTCYKNESKSKVSRSSVWKATLIGKVVCVSGPKATPGFARIQAAPHPTQPLIPLPALAASSP
ncbi:hypothetical protein Tco_0943883 [Tanacetum coccineum]